MDSKNIIGFSMSMARVLKVVREELGADFPSQHMAALVDIASHPDSSIGDIGKRVGMPSSTVSRSVAALSKWSWTKKSGHGLVVKAEDLYEARRKLVNLTQEGKHVIRLMKEAYEEK